MCHKAAKYVKVNKLKVQDCTCDNSLKYKKDFHKFIGVKNIVYFFICSIRQTSV